MAQRNSCTQRFNVSSTDKWKIHHRRALKPVRERALSAITRMTQQGFIKRVDTLIFILEPSKHIVNQAINTDGKSNLILP